MPSDIKSELLKLEDHLALIQSKASAAAAAEEAPAEDPDPAEEAPAEEPASDDLDLDDNF